MAFLPNQSIPPATLSSQLELFFSCRNLPKLDLNSPSDPFVVIFTKDEKKNQFVRMNHTDVAKDNQSPDFSKEIMVDYLFEEVQILRLEVWDSDDKNLYDMSKHDFIGWAEFVLGDLVTAKGQKLAMKLKDKQGKPLVIKDMPSSLTVRCEEVKASNDELIITFAAKDLPKLGWFGKLEPYLQLYRKAEDGGWASIHQTEIQKGNHPSWKETKLSLRRLCNGDRKRPVLIKCLHQVDGKEPKYLAECETSVAEIMTVTSLAFKKRDESTGKLEQGKSHGELQIKKKELKEKHAFIDFVMGGLEINLIIAIDFTGSNGDPKDSASLHYMGGPNYESQYLKVIRSVGRVLEPYDTDRMIGVYGFGANLNPQEKQVSHCFPLTFDSSKAEVYGVEGVAHAYVNALNRVQLYGPTYFAEVIQTVASFASDDQTSERQRYTILLIITDGVINDMQNTADAVVDATKCPLSIVIVGVGTANFSKMEELDADDKPLKHSNGYQSTRDIVQFVPFAKFSTLHIGALAKETLAEIPNQVEQYMEMNKLTPNKRIISKEETMLNMYEGPSKLANGDAVYYPQQKMVLESQPYHTNTQQYMQPPTYGQQVISGNQQMIQPNPMMLQQQQQQQELQQQQLQQQNLYQNVLMQQPTNPYYGASAPPP